MLPIIGLVANILPSLVGHLFGGDAQGITGAVVDAAKQVFGTDDKDAVEKAIAADPSLAMQFKSKLLDIQAAAQAQAHELAMAQLTAEREQFAQEVADKASARAAFAGSKDVIVLGMVQVVGYILVCAGVAYGCFEMLRGTVGLDHLDKGTVAAVFTLIGGVIQQLGNMAMQPNGFFYGSSKEAVTGVKAFASTVAKMGSGK